MKRYKRVVALMRATGVIGVVGVVVGGITYASLTSQTVKLGASSIETATASLQIGSDGSTFGNSINGFDFPNVEPGGPAQPATGRTFYLKNYGSSPLNLRLGIDGTAMQNPNNLDLSKVSVVITPTAGGTAVTMPFAALTAAYASTSGTTIGLSLAPGAVGQYNLQIAMDDGAITGPAISSISINNINMFFSGTTVTS